MVRVLTIVWFGHKIRFHYLGIVDILSTMNV
jgi:hypothetical protein